MNIRDIKDSKKRESSKINQREKKILQLALIIFLSLYIALFYTKKINLITADLGRHIQNGRVMLQERKIPSKNFYSYTEPGYKTLYHHWGAGIIFYKIHQIGRFKGLSLFYIVINTIPILLFFWIAKKETSIKTAAASTILAIPLIASRTEVRPEGFSYLFLALIFLTLYKFRQKDIRFKPALFVITLIQLLWVNLHIFFIFGIFLIGVFWLDALINKKPKKYLKQLTIIGILSTLASLVNPYFFKGLIEPFLIFKEYGYMLVENQSVFFMQKRFPKFLYIHYELMLVTILVIIGLFIKGKKLKNNFIFLVPLVIFSVMGFKMIRLIPLAGFFFIPIIAKTLNLINNQQIKQVIFYSSIILALAGILTQNFYFSPFDKRTGIGLRKDINQSAEFLKQNNLKGPIFNNYDIGGYLIYHLYPDYKVFVDNRPEAYSVNFFNETYKKMQKDEERWTEVDKDHNFQTIYFYRQDATPWAQPFLIERIKDPNWKPIFVDAYTLILVKNNEQNSQLIDEFEIPKEVFNY